MITKASKRLGFVIPVYKEPNIDKKIFEIKSKFISPVIVVVADDENTAILAKSAGAFVPYHFKKLGFGKSLAEGLRVAYYSYVCDLIVTMDADHNVDEVVNLVEKMNSCHYTVDAVIGHEQGNWNFFKRLGNSMVKKFLGINVANPTCGLVCWKRKALEKIPWKYVKCKWDAIHYELLYWAKKRKCIFVDFLFPEHKGKRRYGLRRWLDWYVTLLRMIRIRFLWGWRNF